MTVTVFYVVIYVGVKGFEPSTPCSQSRCANRTALRPENFHKDNLLFPIVQERP